MRKPLLLKNYASVDAFWGAVEGEIVFLERRATRQDVSFLAQFGLRLDVDCAAVMQGRARGIALRWTPENGAEIIADMAVLTRAKKEEEAGLIGQLQGSPGVAESPARQNPLQALHLVSKDEEAWRSKAFAKSRVDDPSDWILSRPSAPALGTQCIDLGDELPLLYVTFAADERAGTAEVIVCLPCESERCEPAPPLHGELPGRPAATSRFLLHRELCFDQRVYFCGNALFPTFGDTRLDSEISPVQHRSVTVRFGRDCWQDALRKATVVVYSELDKLAAAVYARRLARSRE